MRTDEYREKLVARDRRVRQRAPTPRMVRSSGSPLYQRALALPCQDARSQHRPMSDRVPMHNVDCPENSLHSTQPFAGGPHLREAVRVHPQLRVPYSPQLQANMARFDERTLRCPKLLQPSVLPASEPVQLALPILLVPRSDRRVDTDQMRQFLIGRNVHAALGRLARRAPPPSSGGRSNRTFAKIKQWMHAPPRSAPSTTYAAISATASQPSSPTNTATTSKTSDTLPSEVNRFSWYGAY